MTRHRSAGKIETKDSGFPGTLCCIPIKKRVFTTDYIDELLLFQVSEYLSGLVKVFGTEEIVEEISNEVSTELPPSYDAVSSIASVSLTGATASVAASMGSTVGGQMGASGYTPVPSYTQPYTRLDSHETTI